MKMPPIAFLLVATLGSQIGVAQQTVPFTGGIPLAPGGLAGRHLPKMPVLYDTGEGQKIRVVAVTTALEYPWALAFPPGRQHAGHRAGGPPSDYPEREARSSADCGRACFLLGGRIRFARRRPRLHGRRDSSEVCRERARLSLLHEADRREAPDGRDCARPLRRPRPDRRPRHLRPGCRRHVAHRLRP